jgi:hypothetical protein
MDTQPIETDYLVIGAGATAMAFVDTLLSETDFHVVMVDRHHRPGGHWNDAYPFVGLHQPAAFYGVNSRELGTWTKDETGLNTGMYELASGAEVLSHFDQVMRQRFLPSGRVQWFPMSDYSAGVGGTHHFKSLMNGDERQVVARRKLVNATHARTEVPSTHPPKYTVAADVNSIPLNRLPDIQRPHACYTLVGSGKTGMDACLWLLQNGVAPSHIRWIMPRDAWLLDRANTQPGAENLERTIGSTIGQFEAIAEATSSPICLPGWSSAGCSCASTRQSNPACTDAPSFLKRNWNNSGALKTLCVSVICNRCSRRRSRSIEARYPPTPIRSTSTAPPARSRCRPRCLYSTATRSIC